MKRVASGGGGGPGRGNLDNLVDLVNVSLGAGSLTYFGDVCSLGDHAPVHCA